MNMSNFAIWLECFWAVVFPNGWTAALLGGAVLAFFGMWWYYSSNEVEPKVGAMQRVGKRWQAMGWWIFGAAVLVYVLELLVVNLTTVDLLSSKEKLNKADLALVLYKAEHDFAGYCFRNRQLMKDHNNVKAVKEKFAVRSLMTSAEKDKAELARRFSRRLAPTANKRFYPTPDYLPDRQLKSDTVDKLIRRLDLGSPTSERYKMLTATAKNEFTAKENKDALKRLKALLNSEFSKEPLGVKFSGFRDWDDLKKATKRTVTNSTATLRNQLIRENAERVSRIFNSPINPEIRSSAAFEKHLAKIRGEINTEMERQMEELLSTDNVLELRKEIISTLESEAGFKQKDFKEQFAQFNSTLRDELSRQWRDRMQGITNRFLERWETEALLYNDDPYSYQQLNTDQKALNSNLLWLYEASTYLHDLFWLVILLIAALVIFQARGAKIVRAGNKRTIVNKLHNA